MKIEAFRNYVAISRDWGGKAYRWNLAITPGNKAWNLVDQTINSGDMIEGYLILSISKIPSQSPFKGIYGNFEPSYPNSINTYTCDICGGTVVNDRCTECHFDWDS
ncbi:hypothetical protein [Guptibacillus sedimenti]|uniref:hypothetical protein n=1 Tax=Guptibacillus sedimenti TaxID=3025680 RepID=UPI002361706B|nr:hypothetical protein [Pseudalkalibacillus sedimenti]